MKYIRRVSPGIWFGLLCGVLFVAGSIMAQLQQSGGNTNVTVTAFTASLPAGANNIGGVEIFDSGGVNKLAINASGQPTIANSAFALNAGSALIGFVMAIPSGCSGTGASIVVHNTVGVATGAGTSVSAVTGCIVEGFVNNITNNPVTLRVADKTGTPIIWLGGNADFSIPANSNLNFGGNNGVNLSGIVMASGITAIAGTAAALNLHIVTRE